MAKNDALLVPHKWNAPTGNTKRAHDELWKMYRENRGPVAAGDLVTSLAKRKEDVDGWTSVVGSLVPMYAYRIAP